ncbi:MAG: hypothetical protein GY719_00365 [bacterium]|nr:hypothetical protein [bacterium]
MQSGELAIRVDNVTRTLWDASLGRPLQLEIDASAELIEVVAEDETGGFPLVSLLVPFDPGSGRQEPVDASFVLPGGRQRISLRVSPWRDPARAGRGAELELSYSAAGSTTDAAAAQ